MRYAERRIAELLAAQHDADREERIEVAPRVERSKQAHPRPPKFAPGTTEKPCSECGKTLPLDAFSIQKTGALGRLAKCKDCIRVIGIEYTRNNRETKAGRPRSTHCECCREPNTTRRPLHWDHYHKSGEFRGWLCHHCNIALGAADDSIETLEMLIAYLKRGGGPA